LIFNFQFQNEFTAICDLILERQPRKLSGLQIQIRRWPRRSRHERFLGTDLAENRAVEAE